VKGEGFRDENLHYYCQGLSAEDSSVVCVYTLPFSTNFEGTSCKSGDLYRIEHIAYNQRCTRGFTAMQ